MKIGSLAVAATVGAALIAEPAGACTRILFDAGGRHLVGRSMDWTGDTGTDLWAFPAGMKRNGGVGPHSLAWTSRHGSVIASFYEVGTVDGMNDAGLSANALYLADADYGADLPRRKGQPELSIGAVIQYMLDSFSSVDAVVATFREDPYRIIAPKLTDGSAATAHFAVADATGDSAIIEYIDGKVVIHHGPQYAVMTNAPPYSEQLAIARYWDEVDGYEFVPGSPRSADRFARASFYERHVRGIDGERESFAAVLAMTRSISIPYGLGSGGQKDTASTVWRTVADHGAKRYYFESVTRPSLIHVDMGRIDLSEAGKPMKIDLAGDRTLHGDVSSDFAPATPFSFLSR